MRDKFKSTYLNRQGGKPTNRKLREIRCVPQLSPGTNWKYELKAMIICSGHLTS